MDRFNIQFRLHAARRALWRKIVYPAAQQVNAAGATAASIVGLRETTRGWNNPRHISVTALRKGLNTEMIGTVFGGASSSVELFMDGMHGLHERRLGYSPGRALAFEEKNLDHINTLLESRDKLLEDSHIAGDRRELLELKGQLCRYIRNRMVAEFAQWYGSTRALFWYRDTFYVLNIASNFTRFAASLLSLKALDRRRFGGGTGPTQIAGSGIAALAPPLSIAISNRVNKVQTRRAEKKLAVPSPISSEEIEQRFQRLSGLMAETGQLDERAKRIIADIQLLRKHTANVDETIHREAREVLRLRGVAEQRAVAGPLIGLMGVAAGTISTIGYYGYRHEPRINNRLNLPVELLGLNAGSLALYLNPQGTIASFMYEHKLKQEGQFPDQLLDKRLDDLDKLQAAIKSP